jgi:sRNA-binding protein
MNMIIASDIDFLKAGGTLAFHGTIPARSFTPTPTPNHEVARRKHLHRINMDMRIKLNRFFPMSFRHFDQAKFPLMVGIYEAVLKSKPHLGGSRKRVRSAIGNYVGGRTYLRAMIEGAVRVDLHGDPAGIVTAADAKFAAMRLARLDASYG